MSDERLLASRLAGRLRRLAATLIDAVLVPSLTLVLAMLTEVMEDAEDYMDKGWMVQLLLLAVASHLMLNGYGLWRRGQTLGKRLMGIAIVSATAINDPQVGSQPAPLWRLIGLRAWSFSAVVRGGSAVIRHPADPRPIVHLRQAPTLPA